MRAEGNLADWMRRTSRRGQERASMFAGRLHDLRLADGIAGQVAQDRMQDNGINAKKYQSPASALSAAALSVCSQVKSGSSRPKWP
jgi:hypothetical protein